MLPVFTDRASMALDERPELARLVDQARPSVPTLMLGDVVVQAMDGLVAVTACLLGREVRGRDA